MLLKAIIVSDAPKLATSSCIIQRSSSRRKPLSTSSVPPRASRTNVDKQTTTTDGDFYQVLQRYSTLYRIVLARPMSNGLILDEWQRIYIQVVNELGLLLDGEKAKQCCMRLSCRLLVKGPEGFVQDPNYHMETRGSLYDAWETMDGLTSSNWPGFYDSGSGSIDVRIVATHSKVSQKACCPPKSIYIHISPVFEEPYSFHALPLVIGPVEVEAEKSARTNDTWGADRQSKAMHRAFCLDQTSMSVFLIKEGWMCGTPGKMWDSALVLSDMLVNRIRHQPQYLEHRRIIDLSAGTGSVGLLISSIYQRWFPDRMPQITLTDLPEALSLIEFNKNLNFNSDINANVRIEPLEWGNIDHTTHIANSGPVDLIIASDVVYNPSCFSLLVQTLETLSTPGRTVIYLGYKRRGLKEEDEDQFFKLCSANFHISLVQKNQMSDGFGDWEREQAPLVRDSDDGKGWMGILPSGRTSSLGNPQETGVRVYRLTKKIN
ncbi:putative methyltransferase-domain-containing protein [Radiomyces spectabilis]|uniref:putative methyltransferase-domain-containing protein n=1 Tax=Radiomyces spectabilis TaxID=64574 RepID=UPI00221F26DA|nr:putative methyltransferase-domain-containing protein [Radiomyces spectabilis]KAI8369303.1 putative methyltransferase-domain-containing protein [Radiomyces spectabilis]